MSGVSERRLLRRLAAGDWDARRRLIEAHLDMVTALARRYARRCGVPTEDLLQEGALALVRAVDHYDPERGMKLSTYATWWVKQAIRRAAIAQSLPVRVPERLWERAREPSGAGHSSWPDEELEEARRALRPVVSLDAPVGDGTTRLGELLPDPSAEDPAEVAARNDARHRLAGALAILPDRECEVLSKRAGFDGQPRSLAGIGQRLGVSRERTRQLERAALSELRDRRRELRLEGLSPEVAYATREHRRGRDVPEAPFAGEVPNPRRRTPPASAEAG